MSKKYDFDYIVIGSGPAGRGAALKLAKGKKKIAIIEADGLGGAEVSSYNLPSTIALDFAHTFNKFANLPEVKSSSCHFNYPSLLTHIKNTVQNSKNRLRKELEDSGIKLIEGFAHFSDAHTITINESTYTAQTFILATGSKLKAREISGLDTVSYLTPYTVFNSSRLPKFVFVVGGGASGVEIADFFASLGVGVIIMERGPHLLPREDDEVAEIITEHLVNSMGVTVITNAKVIQITDDYNSKIVVFTTGSGEKMVRVDSIVLATGSEPFLDYGLENAGVDYKRNGIIVDKYFTTSAKNIYAIGDALGGEDSTSERSVLEANILTNNLSGHNKFTAKYTGLIRSINTNPEIAIVGLNEHDALSRDLKYKKSIVYLKDVPTIHSPEYQNGFVKLLVNHSGKLIGATVVAPNAKAIIQELSLILTNQLSLELLAITPYSSDNPIAAIPLAAKKLLTK